MNGGPPITRRHGLLRDEEWRDALAANFNGLIPDRPPVTWLVLRDGSAQPS